ncbi:hypothetical protein BDQ12DRAFT_726074 [Crucibulum laeve]|uniref:Uncharacterized protein n=1 Tax=Crucibulum laeve TaxID=68775 RepID=A0A5C3LR99_9AGAR|nr:hypothetical protein BDQ12DRAFT_726074 [Crucibulum laeve]
MPPHYLGKDESRNCCTSLPQQLYCTLCILESHIDRIIVKTFDDIVERRRIRRAKSLKLQELYLKSVNAIIPSSAGRSLEISSRSRSTLSSMRWSLIFYLFAAVAALLALDGTFALPAPRDGALTLDARAVTRSGRVTKPAYNLRKTAARAGAAAAKKQPVPKKKVSTKTPAKKAKVAQAIKAGNLKKSSGTYRKAAMKSPHMFSVKNGKVQRVKTPAKMVSGKFHADHILEAQTAAKALAGAGHTQKSLGKQKWDKVKNALNAPKNMAMLAGDVNTAKGRVCKAGLNGCTPKQADVKLAQGYMKATKSRGKETAAEIDKIVGGNTVQTKHNQILGKAGVKREVISEWEDLD